MTVLDSYGVVNRGIASGEKSRLGAVTCLRFVGRRVALALFILHIELALA